jgi:uncharacterized membrane protein
MDGMLLCHPCIVIYFAPLSLASQSPQSQSEPQQNSMNLAAGQGEGGGEIGKVNAVKNSVRFYFLGQERAINIDTTSQTRTTNTVALNESPQNSRSTKQQSYRDNAIPYRISKFQLRILLHTPLTKGNK